VHPPQDCAACQTPVGTAWKPLIKNLLEYGSKNSARPRMDRGRSSTILLLPLNAPTANPIPREKNAPVPKYSGSRQSKCDPVRQKNSFLDRVDDEHKDFLFLIRAQLTEGFMELASRLFIPCQSHLADGFFDNGQSLKSRSTQDRSVYGLVTGSPLTKSAPDVARERGLQCASEKSFCCNLMAPKVKLYQVLGRSSLSFFKDCTLL
jgi:hypothetical protein